MAKGGFRKMTKAEVKQFDRLMAKAIREGRARHFGPSKSRKKSGKLTYAARKKMAPGNFVFPKGTKAHPGEKKFPIPDLAHGRQALARAAQKRTKLTQDERCKVVRAVCRKFKSLREHKGSVCGGNRDRRLIGQCMSRSR